MFCNTCLENIFKFTKPEAQSPNVPLEHVCAECARRLNQHLSSQQVNTICAMLRYMAPNTLVDLVEKVQAYLLVDTDTAVTSQFQPSEKLQLWEKLVSAQTSIESQLQVLEKRATEARTELANMALQRQFLLEELASYSPTADPLLSSAQVKKKSLPAPTLPSTSEQHIPGCTPTRSSTSTPDSLKANDTGSNRCSVAKREVITLDDDATSSLASSPPLVIIEEPARDVGMSTYSPELIPSSELVPQISQQQAGSLENVQSRYLEDDSMDSNDHSYADSEESYDEANAVARFVNAIMSVVERSQPSPVNIGPAAASYTSPAEYSWSQDRYVPNGDVSQYMDHPYYAMPAGQMHQHEAAVPMVAAEVSVVTEQAAPPVRPTTLPLIYDVPAPQAVELLRAIDQADGPVVLPMEQAVPAEVHIAQLAGQAQHTGQWAATYAQGRDVSTQTPAQTEPLNLIKL